MESAYRQFQEGSKDHKNDNENPNAQSTKEFAAWIEVQAALGHKLTSSQVNIKLKLMLANLSLAQMLPSLFWR